MGPKMVASLGVIDTLHCRLNRHGNHSTLDWIWGTALLRFRGCPAYPVLGGSVCAVAEVLHAEESPLAWNALKFAFAPIHELDT